MTPDIYAFGLGCSAIGGLIGMHVGERWGAGSMERPWVIAMLWLFIAGSILWRAFN